MAVDKRIIKGRLLVLRPRVLTEPAIFVGKVAKTNVSSCRVYYDSRLGILCDRPRYRVLAVCDTEDEVHELIAKSRHFANQHKKVEERFEDLLKRRFAL